MPQYRKPFRTLYFLLYLYLVLSPALMPLQADFDPLFIGGEMTNTVENGTASSAQFLDLQSQRVTNWLSKAENQKFLANHFTTNGYYGETKTGQIINDWEALGSAHGLSGKELQQVYQQWRSNVQSYQTQLSSGNTEAIEKLLDSEFDETSDVEGQTKSGMVITDWEKYAKEKGLPGMGMLFLATYGLWKRRKKKQREGDPDFRKDEKDYGSLQKVFDTAYEKVQGNRRRLYWEIDKQVATQKAAEYAEITKTMKPPTLLGRPPRYPQRDSNAQEYVNLTKGISCRDARWYGETIERKYRDAVKREPNQQAKYLERYVEDVEKMLVMWYKFRNSSSSHERRYGNYYGGRAQSKAQQIGALLDQHYHQVGWTKYNQLKQRLKPSVIYSKAWQKYLHLKQSEDTYQQRVKNYQNEVNQYYRPQREYSQKLQNIKNTINQKYNQWSNKWYDFWYGRYQTKQKEINYAAQKSREEANYRRTLENLSAKAKSVLQGEASRRKNQFLNLYQKVQKYFTPQEIQAITDGKYQAKAAEKTLSQAEQEQKVNTIMAEANRVFAEKRKLNAQRYELEEKLEEENKKYQKNYAMSRKNFSWQSRKMYREKSYENSRNMSRLYQEIAKLKAKENVYDIKKTLNAEPALSGVMIRKLDQLKYTQIQQINQAEAQAKQVLKQKIEQEYQQKIDHMYRTTRYYYWAHYKSEYQFEKNETYKKEAAKLEKRFAEQRNRLNILENIKTEYQEKKTAYEAEQAKLKFKREFLEKVDLTTPIEELFPPEKKIKLSSGELTKNFESYHESVTQKPELEKEIAKLEKEIKYYEPYKKQYENQLVGATSARQYWQNICARYSHWSYRDYYRRAIQNESRIRSQYNYYAYQIKQKQAQLEAKKAKIESLNARQKTAKEKLKNDKKYLLDQLRNAKSKSLENLYKERNKAINAFNAKWQKEEHYFRYYTAGRRKWSWNYSRMMQAKNTEYQNLLKRESEKIAHQTKKYDLVLQPLEKEYQQEEKERAKREQERQTKIAELQRKRSEATPKQHVLEYLKRLNTARTRSVYFTKSQSIQHESVDYTQAVNEAYKELHKKSDAQKEIEKLQQEMSQPNAYSWQDYLETSPYMKKVVARSRHAWLLRDNWTKEKRQFGRGSDYWRQKHARYSQAIHANNMKYTPIVEKTLKYLAQQAYNERMRSYNGWQRHYREHPLVWAEKQKERQNRIRVLQKAEKVRKEKLQAQIKELNQKKQENLSTIWANADWLMKDQTSRAKDKLTEKILTVETEAIRAKEAEALNFAKSSTQASTQGLTEAEVLIQKLKAEQQNLETQQSQNLGTFEASGQLEAFDADKAVATTVRKMKYNSTEEAQAIFDRRNDNYAISRAIHKNNTHHYAGGGYMASRGHRVAKNVVEYNDVINGKTYKVAVGNPTGTIAGGSLIAMATPDEQKKAKEGYQRGHTPTDPSKVQLVEQPPNFDEAIAQKPKAEPKPAPKKPVSRPRTKEDINNMVLNFGLEEKIEETPVKEIKTLETQLKNSLLSVKAPSISEAVFDGIKDGAEFMKGFGRAIWDEIKSLKDLLNWKTYWSLLKAASGIVAAIAKIGLAIVQDGTGILEEIAKALSVEFETDIETIKKYWNDILSHVDANRKGYGVGMLVVSLIPIGKLAKAGKFEGIATKILNALAEAKKNYRVKNPGFQKIPFMNSTIQPMNNLEDLYKLAKKAKPNFDRKLDELADLNGGKSIKTELKDRKRSLEKTNYKYRGNINELKDILRGSLVFDEFSDLGKSISHIKKKFDVVDIKNKFEKPKSSNGYADIKVFVREKGNPNGIISEIQLQWEPLFEIKKKEDVLYAQIRVLDKLDPKRIGLEKQSKAMYENLWKQYPEIAKKYPKIWSLFFK